MRVEHAGPAVPEADIVAYSTSGFLEEEGGIEPLFALVERGAREAHEYAPLPSTTNGGFRWVITSFKNGIGQSFSFQGDVNRVNGFIRTTTALRRLLLLASEGEPKADRFYYEPIMPGYQEDVTKRPVGVAPSTAEKNRESEEWQKGTGLKP